MALIFADESSWACQTLARSREARPQRMDEAATDVGLDTAAIRMAVRLELSQKPGQSEAQPA